ncbi:hypothetical protein [Baia soyae]|uniref:Uncharacterized protein n=1 Tax=Baia soyae TaxID=1544746 RepID=A0A4R2RI20_9BACL|nr:hypothetical protein [Baia soyae]TCP62653.1 hypothetical protein EDD57_15220 [Baia soyae]
MNKGKIISFTMATVIGATALLGTVSTASANEGPRTQITQSTNSPQQVEPQAWSAIGKAAVKFLLRNSDKLIKSLPAKYRGPVYKWRNKTLSVLDDLDVWKESAIIAGLVKVGVPPAEARLIAQWVSWVV